MKVIGTPRPPLGILSCPVLQESEITPYLAGPGPLGDTEVYTADLGGTVTINCPFKPENSEKKKSVCKKTDKGCVTVIDSTGEVNSDYGGRIELEIMGTDQLTFSFIIKQVQLSDAGRYICQIGEDTIGEKSNVDLQVLKPEPNLLYGDLRGSVIFDCALGSDVENMAKFLCRMSNEEACDVVINTLGKKDRSFEGRILLIPKNKRSFSVHITNLRKEDAGNYLCGAHSDGEPQKGSPIQAWQLFVNEGET